MPPRTEAREIISLSTYLKESFNETKLRSHVDTFIKRFPTFSGTIRRLPYALLPFAFSQFILVEALAYTGWINVLSNWLAIVVGFSIPATIFVVGVLSVILCNVSGTNIGATILLVKILKDSNFAAREDIPPKLEMAGMLALAVGSNIGAVSFTFSASLAGIPSHLPTIS
jgi:Na+/H+ antiporter NhaD/arsenite permease-like protein